MRMNGKTEKKLRLAMAALVICGVGIAGGGVALCSGSEDSYDSTETDHNRSGSVNLGLHTNGWEFYAKDSSGDRLFGQTCIGSENQSYGGHNVMVGTASKVYEAAVSVGFSAIGYANSVATGYNAIGYGGSVATGYKATSYAMSAAVGYQAKSYSGSVAIGYWAEAGPNSMTSSSITTGDAAVAIGIQSKATASGSISLGSASSAAYKNSVAIGANSSTTETNSVSVGSSTNKRKIMYVANGTNDTDAATLGQVKTLINNSASSSSSGASAAINSAIKTDAGIYIKASHNSSGTATTDGTVGKNFGYLDSAIGKVETPTSGKLYVIGESLSSGSLANTVSANLLALDQKIGEITSNYGILNNNNTISQNLMALEKAIAAANQTIDFSNTSSTTNTSTTNSNQSGAANSGTTTASNTIYANDGTTKIAEFRQGSVSAGNTGFVSGGQVFNADVATGQTISFSDATRTVNGKQIASNQITSNDGTVLATFTKMQEVSASDNGFVSGSDLYSEVRPEDGKYVKNDSTTGANLNALDGAVSSLDDAVAALDKKTEGLITTEGGDGKDGSDGTGGTGTDGSSGTGTDGSSGTGGGSGTGGTIHIGGGSSADNVTIINISKSDGTPRTLTGVADGVNDYDAVNMRQYNALSTDVRAVAAGSAALAALHPGTYNPDDKMSFAVGFGHYKDANAGALGAFYKPNEDTMISVAGTVGNGNPMWNLGLSFKLGERGQKAKTYRDGKELTRDMNSLQKDSAEQAAKIKTLEADKNLCTKKNDAQDKKIAAQEKTIQLQAKKIEAQEKKIASLEAQVAQIMKKVELSSTVKKTAAAH